MSEYFFCGFYCTKYILQFSRGDIFSFSKALLCQISSVVSPLSVCCKGWGGRKVNNKKQRVGLNSSCLSFVTVPWEFLLLWQHSALALTAVQGAVESVTHAGAIVGAGLGGTDSAVCQQQWGGRLCLRRAGGDRCAPAGPAVSLHARSRCSSQGRWESFRFWEVNLLSPRCRKASAVMPGFGQWFRGSLNNNAPSHALCAAFICTEEYSGFIHTLFP